MVGGVGAAVAVAAPAIMPLEQASATSTPSIPSNRRMGAQVMSTNGTLKTYPGFPHGMLTTHADVINADFLAFIKS